MLLGTRMNLSDPMLDLLLVQWALGSLWCGKMSCPVWPECEGSSWISKAWMPLLALMFARPKSNWAPLEHYLLLHMTLQNCTTDYPTAHWCSDPYVRGDPPGSHPLSHKKHAQMLLKNHRGTWRPYRLLKDITAQIWSSCFLFLQMFSDKWYPVTIVIVSLFFKWITQFLSIVSSFYSLLVKLNSLPINTFNNTQ